MVWSIFYELTGFGCGWGPMNARFDPMFGGFRHFLRPGTTKLPPFPGLPALGGNRRNWLDVALYAANQLFLLRALVAPEVTPELLVPSVVLIPLMGVLDKMLFLAAAPSTTTSRSCASRSRSRRRAVDLGCKARLVLHLVLGGDVEAQPPFPVRDPGDDEQRAVLPEVAEEAAVPSYPDDLRASPFAVLMARMGTLTEYAIPFVLAANISPLVTGRCCS